MVTGAQGMLGTDAVTRLRADGHDVTEHTRQSLDLSDVDAVVAAVRGHDVVWNCAAWTAVDDAETEEDAALAVNGVAPGILAAAAAEAGARLVQISTDYVFAGDATEPYAEDAPTDAVPPDAAGAAPAAGFDGWLAAFAGTPVTDADSGFSFGGSFAQEATAVPSLRDTVNFFLSDAWRSRDVAR